MSTLQCLQALERPTFPIRLVPLTEICSLYLRGIHEAMGRAYLLKEHGKTSLKGTLMMLPI